MFQIMSLRFKSPSATPIVKPVLIPQPVAYFDTSKQSQFVPAESKTSGVTVNSSATHTAEAFKQHTVAVDQVLHLDNHDTRIRSESALL
jgi:hypothetical protein